MATNYPGSLDTGTEQPSPSASTEMDDAGFEHDVVHTNHSGAIIALETKVGTGSSTAVADSVLAGTGSGTSGWSTAPSLAGLTVDTDTLYVDGTNDRVGIGTTSPEGSLHIEKDLGTAANDTEILQRFKSDVGANTSFLTISNIRESAGGSTWNSAHHRIQHRVDSTDMAYIDFNPESAERGLSLGTDNVERVTIDSSGNVGIGTTSPGKLLEIANGTEASILLDDTGGTVGGATNARVILHAGGVEAGSMGFPATGGGLMQIENRNGGLYLETDSADDISLRTNGNTRMVVKSDGKVGIGTTTPRGVFDVATSGNVYLIHNTLQQGTVDTYLGGHVFFSPWDTTDDVYLQARRSNDSGNTNMYFRTTNSGSIVNAMRITSSGNVGIGTTTPGEMLEVGSASNYGSFRVHAWKGSESFRVTQNIVRSENIKQLTTSSAANVYVATSNGTMYRSTSSLKYKTNVETMEDSYADAILGLRPVWYRSLGPDDPASYGYWGFIAEEVAEVDPRLVNFGVPEDYVYEYDDDGEKIDPAVADLTEPEGVQYDRMVPHLVNLLKRHEARIAALEAA